MFKTQRGMAFRIQGVTLFVCLYLFLKGMNENNLGLMGLALLIGILAIVLIIVLTNKLFVQKEGEWVRKLTKHEIKKKNDKFWGLLENDKELQDLIKKQNKDTYKKE